MRSIAAMSIAARPGVPDGSPTNASSIERHSMSEVSRRRISSTWREAEN
jgi:hypothetical protein